MAKMLELDIADLATHGAAGRVASPEQLTAIELETSRGLTLRQAAALAGLGGTEVDVLVARADAGMATERALMLRIATTIADAKRQRLAWLEDRAGKGWRDSPGYAASFERERNQPSPFERELQAIRKSTAYAREYATVSGAALHSAR